MGELRIIDLKMPGTKFVMKDGTRGKIISPNWTNRGQVLIWQETTQSYGLHQINITAEVVLEE